MLSFRSIAVISNMKPAFVWQGEVAKEETDCRKCKEEEIKECNTELYRNITLH